MLRRDTTPPPPLGSLWSQCGNVREVTEVHGDASHWWGVSYRTVARPSGRGNRHPLGSVHSSNCHSWRFWQRNASAVAS